MENAPTLESIIAEQTKGFKPEEVHDLDCAFSVVTTLSDVFGKFTNLEILNLSSVGLSSLSGFPVLPNLSELDLSHNKISGGLEELESCPKLLVLNLGGNPIKDISAIKPLASLTQLQTLDLSECELSKTEGYQTQVFDLIQSLISLNGFDKDNKPVEDEGDGCSEDEDGSDSEDEEDGEDEVGLSYLQKSDLGDDDSKDYEAPEGADDDDDEDDASDEEDIEEDEVKQAAVEETDVGELRRGRKRKQEVTDEDSNQDSNQN